MFDYPTDRVPLFLYKELNLSYLEQIPWLIIQNPLQYHQPVIIPNAPRNHAIF